MCHLIFVCKYRKKLLVHLGDDVKQRIHDIAKRYRFGIIEMEVDKDHIHLLLQYDPTRSVLEIVRLLKTNDDMPYLETAQRLPLQPLLEKKNILE